LISNEKPQVCFAGGMFGLGSHEEATHNSEKQMRVAKEVTEACFVSYNTTQTGLSPDFFSFQQTAGPVPGKEKKFMLRPGSISSTHLFIFLSPSSPLHPFSI
jgi:hypothetical protein